MNKKLFKVMLLFVCISGQLFAHSGKPDFHVIIDTDGGLDDMRAISMFLSYEDIRVIGITCSQGVLSPKVVSTKINSLLSAYHHEGIPVGMGKKTGSDLPDWSAYLNEIRWNNSSDDNIVKPIDKANGLINDILKDYPQKITLIALGSLKTYADWISTNPDQIDKIERIVWFNDKDIKQGFNYKASPESFEIIKKSGLRLEIVSNNTDQYFIDDTYIETLHKGHSLYAEQIVKLHSQPEVVKIKNQQNIYLWDDFVPLYIINPVLFNAEKKENLQFNSINSGIPTVFLYEKIAEILESGLHTNNRVFESFPVDPVLYKPMYAEILDSTLEKYGPIEWKAICMTNEIHGHTGIYSIIGAKMGIRAMEYFNIGVNNFYVVTFAGNKPPLSCFNDGIQISSGATIGQGLIVISDSIINIPTAIFEFNNQKIRMSVKPEIADGMRRDIKYGVETYGLLSQQYWIYIEELAVKYWSEFDRHDIFLIEPVHN